MKLITPEICWHDRKPIYSIDFQYINGNRCRLATSGTDKNVRIWGVNFKDAKLEPEFLSTLSRHLSGVNCVRFSPNGEFLASAGDDNVVLIWKLDESQNDAPALFGEEDEQDECKETWKVVSTLRGHLQDIYDLSWSGDGNFIITGSIDNCAILFDVRKGTNLGMLREAKSFVQGVAYDPLGEFAATLSSDRILRIYNAHTKQCLYKVSKLTQPSEGDEKPKSARLFHDDGSAYKSFFRRLAFSPDGELLIAPAGCLEQNDEIINATHVFTRGNFSKPAVYLPAGPKVALAVRFCPMLFELRGLDKENAPEKEVYSLYKLPYRMVFAVATEDSVILYDTQQKTPFGMVSNIHYSLLNDLSWSSDGRLLAISSSDGYVSLILFDAGELGTQYKGKIKAEFRKEVSNLKNSVLAMKQQNQHNNSPKMTKVPSSPMLIKPTVVTKPVAPQSSPKQVGPQPRRVNLISLNKTDDKQTEVINAVEKMEIVSENKGEEKMVIENQSNHGTVIAVNESDKEKQSNVVDLTENSPVKAAPRRINFTTLKS